MYRKMLLLTLLATICLPLDTADAGLLQKLREKKAQKNRATTSQTQDTSSLCTDGSCEKQPAKSGPVQPEEFGEHVGAYIYGDNAKPAAKAEPKTQAVKKAAKAPQKPATGTPLAKAEAKLAEAQGNLESAQTAVDAAAAAVAKAEEELKSAEFAVVNAKVAVKYAGQKVRLELAAEAVQADINAKIAAFQAAQKAKGKAKIKRLRKEDEEKERAKVAKELEDLAREPAE